MPLLADAFCGGMYKALSSTFAADLCVNLFPETRRVEGSRKVRVLYGTPGRTTVATGTGNRCRGWFSQDGLTIVVFGSTAYTFDAATATLTSIGTITDNGQPVSMVSNGAGGDQVAIVGGDELKIYDTGTSTLSAAISLPFSGPVMVAFMDGYFLINQRDSPIVWFSALEDGTSWDALDFFARSGTSDNVIGIGVAKSRVWVFGSATTTLFYDSGDADTPFVPYPESVAQVGAIVWTAIASHTDTFYWLATAAGGPAFIAKAAGDPTPSTVSTPPIEQFLQQCGSLADAEAWIYEQAGHTFVVITAPGSDEAVQTYVFDDVEGLWHARADWNEEFGVYQRWTANASIVVGQTVYVGHSANATIATLELDVYTDFDGTIRRQRRMPYLSDDTGNWGFAEQVELSAEVGVGTGAEDQGEDPLVTLEISRDAARTFINAGTAPLGELGEYGTRCIWRRLGRARLDRLVLDFSMTDPVKVAWLGPQVRVTAGTGQL